MHSRPVSQEQDKTAKITSKLLFVFCRIKSGGHKIFRNSNPSVSPSFFRTIFAGHFAWKPLSLFRQFFHHPAFFLKTRPFWVWIRMTVFLEQRTSGIPQGSWRIPKGFSVSFYGDDALNRRRSSVIQGGVGVTITFECRSPPACVHPPDRMLLLIESSYDIDGILSYPRIYGIWRFWFLQPWTMRCNASSQFGINSLWVFDPIPWTQYGYSPAPCMPMFDLFWKSMYDAMNHWWYDRCYTLWHSTATGLTHTALIHTQSSYYHTSSAYF